MQPSFLSYSAAFKLNFDTQTKSRSLFLCRLLPPQLPANYLSRKWKKWLLSNLLTKIRQLNFKHWITTCKVKSHHISTSGATENRTAYLRGGYHLSSSNLGKLCHESRVNISFIKSSNSKRHHFKNSSHVAKSLKHQNKLAANSLEFSIQPKELANSHPASSARNRRTAFENEKRIPTKITETPWGHRIQPELWGKRKRWRLITGRKGPWERTWRLLWRRRNRQQEVIGEPERPLQKRAERELREIRRGNEGENRNGRRRRRKEVPGAGMEVEEAMDGRKEDAMILRNEGTQKKRGEAWAT